MHPVAPSETVREKRLAQVIDRLTASGHRLSPQRLAILRSLTMSAVHPSAEDIFAEIRAGFPNASLATVYKTIDALKAVNELRTVSIAAGRAHYDVLNLSSHPHVVCRACGRTEDVSVGDLKSQARIASERSGYSISEEKIEFVGLCPSCRLEPNQN